MKIPPPPTIPSVPKSLLFPGAAEKQRNDKLGADIRAMLDNLLRATYMPGLQEMLTRFKSVVRPGDVFDLQRLPYTATGPNLTGDRPAGRLPALACLYTRLSWIVQLYWTTCLTDNKNEEHIRQYMQEIEDMLALRDDRGNKLHLQQILTRCSVGGNVRDGFWLEVPGDV